jgi:PhzF family phenazine biosynthesis protein
MREYNYRKVDAFTSGKSLGNPAACIYLEDNQSLSDSEMLSIAKQHKGFVSEVVYCSVTKQSEFHLTYYSSECEVEFCGHGTIACMYSLIKSTPSLLEKKQIAIHTNKKGKLTVYNKITEQDAVFITAPKPTFIGTALTSEIIAKSLGLETDRISNKYPIDLIDAGLATLIVPIATLSDEINIFPNEQNLKRFCLDNKIDIILIFSMEVKDNKNIAHTRVFAPKFGYLEDAATGSGNSAFGYYMLKNSTWKGNNISIEQGGANIEFNTIKLTTDNNSILFGGCSTDRIVGKYFL